MRAGWRFRIAAFVAASIFGSAPVLAQDIATPSTNTVTPPTETVGPRELRDFTINGTVTRPAPTPPERAPVRVLAPTTGRATTAAPSAAPVAPANRPARPSVGDSAATPSVAQALREAAPQPGSAATPGLGADASPGLEPEFEPSPVAPQSAPTEQPANLVPWLLALLLLAGGAGYFFWRQRSRPGYASAGAAPFMAAEPERRPKPLRREPARRPEPARKPTPTPAPVPTPALQPAATPAPRPVQPSTAAGLVTVSLRPWLDIEFLPGRCVVENDKTTIQFDVAIINSGSAPARDVLIEASMFNAGPAQDQEIGAFFAHPVAKGDRIPAIPPLRRVALKSAVSLTREQLRQYEVGGRKLFVPLVGLSALYRWSSGEGQTSASYVVGRDTDSDKMAPLRLDLGPRIFRGLGARRHNVAVRN
jgi:hypothetical protein